MMGHTVRLTSENATEKLVHDSACIINTMEPLYTDTPEMRISPLIRTLKAVPRVSEIDIKRKFIIRTGYMPG